MLQIKNISKTYKTGDLIQVALNDVSLNFRDNEFVAILGPSGSGKTTLLNIVGGLDRYDKGDLIINGISTKKYKDRDYDAYRNHTIGFVFQSYNLIPHQIILSNVELALTIGGVSFKERRKRALDALEEVGLKQQAHKKPNQMSGGQMQRVAIARALVNNPDILLADEPTGALDTTTSLQVMELLKKVAQKRLVVMVTHNPELAESYANRIVKLKDGVIISDSNPYILDKETIVQKKKFKKASMSLFTALSLSFNNLLTKKGRTILTAFAGSIGIIGIALILSLSTGFQNYIDKIQEDTMSSYPLTIQSETSNVFAALLSAKVESDSMEVQEGSVHEQMMISSMMNSVGSNDLKSFTKWLKENKDKYSDDVAQISYAYSISPRIYTKDVTNAIVQLNPNTLISSFYSDSASSLFSSISSSSSMGTFSEHDVASLKENCNLLIGDWPNAYNEVIIVLSQEGKISDLLVYSLGLRENKELKTLISDVMAGEESSIQNSPMTFTYEELMNVELKLIDVSNLYQYNQKYDTYEDMTSDEAYMEKAYQNGETLKVVGIAVNDSDSSSIAGVVYLPELVDHVIEVASTSKIVQKQIANKDVDVFSGNRFDEENEEEDFDFNELVSVDEEMLQNAFTINISEDDFKDALNQEDILENAKYVSSNIASKTRTYLPTVTTLYQNVLSGLLTNITSNFKVVVATHCPDENGDLQINTNANGCSLAGYTYTDMASLSVSGMSTVSVYENNYVVSYSYPSILVSTISANQSATFEALYANLPSSITSVVSKDSLKSVCLDGFNSFFTSAKDQIFDETSNQALLVKTIEDTLTNSDNASLILNDAMSLSALELSAEAIGKSVGTSMSSISSLFGEDMMSIDTDAFANAFNFEMEEDELSRLMSSMMTSSSASYSNNLINLGYQDKEEPTSISIYFNDFDSKENFLSLIDEYNEQVEDEEKEISYTDITGILMSSVKTIIDSVTYVLIAFVSISLVVSSIMIAVITLISVMERTKEIGILRAMGASKHNVSSIFNAETFIIGLLSGVLGIGVTLSLIPLINNIIHNLTSNYDINATLPTNGAVALIVISVVLTMVAGLIPSRKASKQDPVIALRSE